MWELLQQQQIYEAKGDARKAVSKIDNLETKVGIAEDRIERLSLACQAMWELLRDHTGVTEEQLYDKVLEIDVRDGALDGKIETEVINCPHCARKTSTHRMRCIYCGKGIRSNHPFKA